MGPFSAYIGAQAALTMGQMLSGWATGKAQDRQAKQQGYENTLARKQQGQQTAMGQAASYLNQRYDNLQGLRSDQRRSAMFVNGLSNAVMQKLPAWYLPPDMRDLQKTARQINPEAFTPTEKPGGGSSWKDYLGLGLGAAAQIGGGAYGSYRSDSAIQRYLDNMVTKPSVGSMKKTASPRSGGAYGSILDTMTRFPGA